MKKNMRSWFVWCGIEHCETMLTKAEAIAFAEEASKNCERILICKSSPRHPRGTTVAGIVYGRKFGKIFEGGEANA